MSRQQKAASRKACRSNDVLETASPCSRSVGVSPLAQTDVLGRGARYLKTIFKYADHA